MAFQPISRRAALKGLGVSIALPLLEAMAPSVRAADAAAGAERLPRPFAGFSPIRKAAPVKIRGFVDK